MDRGGGEYRPSVGTEEGGNAEQVVGQDGVRADINSDGWAIGKGKDAASGGGDGLRVWDGECKGSNGTGGEKGG